MKHTRTRAWRRFQLLRMKRRAFRKLSEENWIKDREQALIWARKIANHLASCSCAGCGNPRRYFNERTMAEKRSDDSFRQQVQDLEGNHRVHCRPTSSRLRSV